MKQVIYAAKPSMVKIYGGHVLTMILSWVENVEIWNVVYGNTGLIIQKVIHIKIILDHVANYLYEEIPNPDTFHCVMWQSILILPNNTGTLRLSVSYFVVSNVDMYYSCSDIYVIWIRIHSFLCICLDYLVLYIFVLFLRSMVRFHLILMQDSVLNLYFYKRYHLDDFWYNCYIPYALTDFMNVFNFDTYIDYPRDDMSDDRLIVTIISLLLSQHYRYTHWHAYVYYVFHKNR